VGGADGAGGAVVGSGGEESGSGGQVSPSGGSGAQPGEEIDTLIEEFSVFWDFENANESEAVARVGDARLELLGSSVSNGDLEGVLQLSGTDSHARSHGASVDVSGDFSVSAWIKLDDLSGYDTFVSAPGQQVSAFYLQKRDNQRLSFVTFASDEVDASPCVSTAEIQPRQAEWYHVVGTRGVGSGEQRVYVDGVLSGKTTCSGAPFAPTGELTIGSGFYAGTASDFFSGAMDDVGLIERELTAQQVFQLYRAGRPTARHYLFSYFVEVGEGRGDGLRLAHSHDGLHWGAIGQGRVFMPPSVGGGSFRDPHILSAPDGVYHLVWTTSCVPWAEANCVQDRGLGHATSADLVTWSQADYITVDLNVEHVWAPESIYDPSGEQFMIFWSSPIDNNPQTSDPHQIYFVLTKDFETFTQPAVLYAPSGRNVIDATIRPFEAGWLMVVKDEADGQKNLRALTSPLLFGDGAWTVAPSPALTGNYAAEGPSFLERNGELFIYFDKYGEGSYGALQAQTSDALDTPQAWRDISADVFFPGVRHGTAFEVSWEIYEQVALFAGQK
jgi:hypothetical protein